MSVNCKILLPGNVQIKDVAQVIGVAAGLKTKRNDLGSGAWSLDVIGLEVRASTSVITMAVIDVWGELVDGGRNHSVYYHFESSIGNNRLLSPSSTAFWIAVGHRLVDFFGGLLDYNDCDDVYEDYSRYPKSSRRNCPQDGKPWQELQERKEKVKVITVEEMNWLRPNAAYKDA